MKIRFSASSLAAFMLAVSSTGSAQPAICPCGWVICLYEVLACDNVGCPQTSNSCCCDYRCVDFGGEVGHVVLELCVCCRYTCIDPTPPARRLAGTRLL